MSTNAIIGFQDKSRNEIFYVYKHWDGYPEHILETIEKAKAYAWTLPRYEADEFSASYVTANKDKEGDIRLCNGVGSYLDYFYLVTCEDGVLKVSVRDIESKTIMEGTLDELLEKVKEGKK